MTLLAAARRCSCHRMLLFPSLAARRGDQRAHHRRDYHATAPLRQQALSNADMVAWHDGASVVEAVTPNGLIVVNGVTIQGSVMVFPRLSLLWHVSGLEDVNESNLSLLSVYHPRPEHFILGVGETTPAIPPEVKEYCRRLCDASAPIAPQPQLPACLLPGSSVRADSSCLMHGNRFCKPWCREKRGITVEAMSRQHAASTFNFMCQEGRHVVAAFPHAAPHIR